MDECKVEEIICGKSQVKNLRQLRQVGLLALHPIWLAYIHSSSSPVDDNWISSLYITFLNMGVLLRAPLYIFERILKNCWEALGHYHNLPGMPHQTSYSVTKQGLV